MTISEEIRQIKIKNTPKDMKIKTSNFCKNTYAYSLGECAKCGMCGREFNENGAMIKDSDEYETD